MDQGLGLKVQPGPTSGPNPAVAGMLAGIFPFGVGAVYCSQYAKGLSHLVIFVLMILGLSADLPWYVDMVLGVSLAFFYVYQIIDAVRTAKAIQLGSLLRIRLDWHRRLAWVRKSTPPRFQPGL